MLVWVKFQSEVASRYVTGGDVMYASPQRSYGDAREAVFAMTRGEGKGTCPQRYALPPVERPNCTRVSEVCRRGE